jgi:hypothetical protein
MQLDLFTPSSAITTVSSSTVGLAGLCVTLPSGCHACGSNSSSSGPHWASVVCDCGAHRGWLPRQAAIFITDIIDNIGRPTQPIIIRKDQSKC